MCPAPGPCPGRLVDLAELLAPNRYVILISSHSPEDYPILGSQSPRLVEPERAEVRNRTSDGLVTLGASSGKVFNFHLGFRLSVTGLESKRRPSGCHPLYRPSDLLLRGISTPKPLCTSNFVLKERVATGCTPRTSSIAAEYPATIRGAHHRRTGPRGA